MRRHHGYGHGWARAALSRPGATQPRRSGPDGSRWGLWLTSLVVAAAAVIGVVLTGASGASTGVPAQIQLGSLTATASTSTTTMRATNTTGAPVHTSTSTTTTVRTLKDTTVIRPLAKVSDHEDSIGGDKSSAGN